MYIHFHLEGVKAFSKGPFRQVKRISAKIVEAETSHVPFVTKPKEVAVVIKKAAPHLQAVK